MTTPLTKRVNIGHSEIVLDPEGIVRVYATDRTYSKTDIKAIHDTISELTDRKKTLLLLVTTTYTMIDDEARHFLSTPEAELNFIAKAYVINSLAHRLILNFVIQVKGTPVPAKFFTEKKTAIDWLKSFKQMAQAQSN